MPLRVLRLVAAASMLVFGLTAPAATATHASTDDLVADEASAVVEAPPIELDEPAGTDPSLLLPKVGVQLPEQASGQASDTVGLGPAEVDEPEASEEPAVEEGGSGDSPPLNDPAPEADAGASDGYVDPADADAATDTPDIDPSLGDPEEPVATDGDLPSTDSSSNLDSSLLNDPAIESLPATDPLAPKVPATTMDEISAPLATDIAAENEVLRRAAAVLDIMPAATPSPAPVAAVAQPLASPAVAPELAGVSAGPSIPPAVVDEAASAVTSPMPTPDREPDNIDSVSGFVATVAVTNRVPAAVAVAIEFGRTGNGWAGAIVFNLWLRRQLRERRMSQRQLAAQSGVNHSTISRLLRDDRRPSLTTATKLARALRHTQGEPETADYFDRSMEDTFPARRVERALRADELLDDHEVIGLMKVYLQIRRRRQMASQRDPVDDDRVAESHYPDSVPMDGSTS